MYYVLTLIFILLLIFYKHYNYYERFEDLTITKKIKNNNEEDFKEYTKYLKELDKKYEKYLKLKIPINYSDYGKECLNWKENSEIKEDNNIAKIINENKGYECIVNKKGELGGSDKLHNIANKFKYIEYDTFKYLDNYKDINNNINGIIDEYDKLINKVVDKYEEKKNILEQQKYIINQNDEIKNIKTKYNQEKENNIDILENDVNIDTYNIDNFKKKYKNIINTNRKVKLTFKILLIILGLLTFISIMYINII